MQQDISSNADGPATATQRSSVARKQKQALANPQLVIKNEPAKVNLNGENEFNFKHNQINNQPVNILENEQLHEIMAEGGSKDELVEEQSQTNNENEGDENNGQMFNPDESHENSMDNTQEVLLGNQREEEKAAVDSKRDKPKLVIDDVMSPQFNNRNYIGGQRSNFESPKEQKSDEVAQLNKNSSISPEKAELIQASVNSITNNVENPFQQNVKMNDGADHEVSPNFKNSKKKELFHPYVDRHDKMLTAQQQLQPQGITSSVGPDRVQSLKTRNYQLIGSNASKTSQYSRDSKQSRGKQSQTSKPSKVGLKKNFSLKSQVSSTPTDMKSQDNQENLLQGDRISMQENDIFPKSKNFENQRNQGTKNKIKQEVEMMNVNKQDPIQIGSAQLGTQNLLPEGETCDDEQCDSYRHLPAELRHVCSRTRTPSKQLRDLTKAFRLAAKKQLSNQLNSYDQKFEQWKKLQTANRYHEDITSQFLSVKDVFKQRIQFKKKSQKLKERLERQCNIGYKEYHKYTSKTITIKQKAKIQQQIYDDFENDEEENKEDSNFIKTYWKKFNEMYTDSLQNVKDEKTFFVHGKIHRFSKLSLGLLDNKTKFRFFLVWLTTSAYFETFIILLISLNSIFLGIKDYTDVKNESARNDFVETSDIYFIVIFTFECISKVCAQGFIMGRNSYLSDLWNWLDFIVVVTSLLTFIPAMRSVSGLRTFRLFRPLRSLTTMPSMKLLIGTLFQSVAQLGGIMGLAVFFFAIFAILGVSLWNGIIHYRCYATEFPDENGFWEASTDTLRLCSGHQDCISYSETQPANAPQYPWCGSRYELYALPDNPYNLSQKTLNQDSDLYELNYGITNFDHIGSAFLTIFQCITMEGWNKIMNIYEDGDAAWVVISYFVMCVVICSFFLLNLTIAVMLMKYEELDKSQDNNKHIEHLRQRGRLIKLPVPLIDFLIRQDSLQIASGAGKMLKQEDSFFKQLFSKKEHQVDIREAYYQKPIVQRCYGVIMHRYFDATIMLIIMLNTFTLALDAYPQVDQWFWEFQLACNYIFTTIFTLEAILKIIGLGPRAFAREKLNQFDLTIVIISIIELFQGSQNSVFSGFRAFRLFKIFRLFKAGDLRILLDSIQFTLTSIGDYVILLFLFIYVFTLMGMSFFAGRINFVDGDRVVLEKRDIDGQPGLEQTATGEPPRAHFDHFAQAVVTIFFVLFGEGWNDIMYNCMRCTNFLPAFYFIMLVIGGNIIMLNLFLAILLGNFDKARNFAQKKKVFAAFSEIMLNGKSLNDALDIILGDMSAHVKEKVLRWDKKQVTKMHKDGDTKVGEGLAEDNFRFMSIDQSLHDNIIDQKLKRSFGDDEIQSEVQVDQAKNSDIDEPPKPPEAKKSKRWRGERYYGEDGKVLRDSVGQHLTKSVKTEEASIAKKNKQRKESEQARKALQSFGSPEFNKRSKNYRYSKTVEKVHKENPNLKRLREFNRQSRIQPFKGLKEIINKKNLDDARSLNESEKERARKHDMQREWANEQKTPIQLDKERQENEQRSPQGSRKNRGKKQRRSQTVTYDDDDKRKDLLSQARQEELNLNKEINQHSKPSSIEPKMLLGNQQDPQQDGTLQLVEGMSKDPSGGQAYQNKDYFNQTLDNEAEEQELDQEFADDQKVHKPLKHRICDYLVNSSIFLFHRTSKIRNLCLTLAESQEVLSELEKMELSGDLENYNNDGESGNSVAATLVESKERSHSGDEENGGSKKRIFAFSYSATKNAKQPSQVFEDIILILIVLSSLQLALDSPLADPESGFKYVLRYIESVFTVLFFIEAAIKIIAKGLLFNKMGPVWPYLRSAWNVLDGFVVAASLLDLVFTIMNFDVKTLQSLKALRALRALRPLRVISKNEGMRLVVNALLASFPSMRNVVLVCSLFLLIFSLIGVNFFKGGFQKCEPVPGTELTVPISEITNKTNCIEAGGYMRDSYSNFNNCGLSMITLFQMMTTEGWVDVAYNGIDCVGIDQQPRKDHQPLFMFFFISFMIVGSQFIINLFVGVVIDNFNTIKEKEELGNMFVTEQQRSWIEIQKVGQGKKLRVKINEPVGFQKIFYDIVVHAYFEYTIIFFIVLNTIIMGMKHYQMPDQLVSLADQANYVFAFVFNVEMILKLLGLRKVYFYTNWNLFDMLIVVLTNMGILLKWLNVQGSISQASTVIRAFRIMRMFKLIRASVHFRVILETLFNILPQIANVMTLILLLFFIYALLGLQTFSGVMLKDLLDEKNNFQSFPRAMVVLMRFATGEDWNVYMYELAEQDYNGVQCITGQTYEEQQEKILGCGSPFSYFYFLSFTVLVSMLIMNLTVAAVIEGLDTAKKENMGIVQGDEIEILIDYWQFYDPLATGWIKLTDLVFLLYELPAPLGKKTNKMIDDQYEADPDDKKQGVRQQDRYLVNYEKKIVMKKIDALELLKDLKIKVHSDPFKQIHFVDVFKALMKRIFIEREIDYKLGPNLNKKIKCQWDKKHKQMAFQKSKYTAREQHAGFIITKWARKCLNSQKNSSKKNEKRTKAKAVSHHKSGSRQNQAFGALERKYQRQQELESQAKVIFNIIHGVKSDDGDGGDQEHHDYKVKNNYSWKGAGGEKLLARLHDYKSEETESEIGSDGEPYRPFKITKKLIEGEENEFENISQQQSPESKNEKEGELFKDELFGALPKNSATSRPGTGRGKQKQQVAGVEHEHKQDKISRDKELRIEINVINMDNGLQDTDQKNVFQVEANGLIRRNEQAERREKVLEKKKGNYVDPMEDVQYMPNQRYNAYQKQKFMYKEQQLISKAEVQARVEKNHERMLNNHKRDKEIFDAGGTGDTIAMDERYIETKDYHHMTGKLYKHQKIKNFELDNFEVRQTEKTLFAKKPPLQDLIPSAADKHILPARAFLTRPESSGKLSSAASYVGKPEGFFTKAPNPQSRNTRDGIQSQANQNLGQLVAEDDDAKEVKTPQNGLPANPLLAQSEEGGADSDQNIKKVIANNFFKEVEEKEA